MFIPPFFVIGFDPYHIFSQESRQRLPFLTFSDQIEILWSLPLWGKNTDSEVHHVHHVPICPNGQLLILIERTSCHWQVPSTLCGQSLFLVGSNPKVLCLLKQIFQYPQHCRLNMCHDTNTNESPVYGKQTYGDGQAKNGHVNEGR